jgi:deazaflavin-dependent oxidoreductase (nitroreductase family)
MNVQPQPVSAGRKRTIVVWFERYLQNPPVKAALLAGLPMPLFALVETTGRRTGRRRRTPVINGLDGRHFWIVAEHGHHADYVHNIEADPAVRVKSRGVWRTGTATSCPTTTRTPGPGGCRTRSARSMPPTP